MSAYTLQQQAGWLHGRQMTMLVTVALHALVIAGLMATHVIPDLKISTPLAPIDLPPVERTVETPPPSTPIDHFDKPPPIPLVIDTLNPVIPPDETNAVVATVPPLDAGPVTPAANNGAGTSSIAQIPSTTLQYRAVRPADDYYPSASLSMQERGTAIVRVCVAPSGKLDGAPVIEAGSGSSRLDAAALRWAREALRFTPATRGGVAIGACKGFRVNFTLH